MTGFRVFSLFGVPVSVSVFYFLLVFFGLRQGLMFGLIWAVSVTVSLLVHEFGHALVAKYFRLSPEVLLHGLGGLCAHQPARRDSHSALIIAAGPSAGLALGGLVFATSVGLQIGGVVVPPWGQEAIRMLLFVNIGWSILNLLPLWPLDGGQLFRLGLKRFVAPATADRWTHLVSLVLLSIAAAFVVATGQIFLGLLVALGFYENYQRMRLASANEPVRRNNPRIDPMLKAARDAYDQGDFREAFRLSHVIRGESGVTPNQMRQVYALLGPAAARMGEHEEALRWLSRAPNSPEVTEAKVESLFALRRDDELRELLDSPAFKRLPSERREEIRRVVEAEL